MSDPRLYLRLIGVFNLRETSGEIELTSQPAKALMGVLALSPNRTASRSALAALLWGDREEARARQNLRQSLHRLRDAVGPDAVVVVDGERLRLSAVVVATDEEALRTEIADGRAPEALLSSTFAADHLMEGFDGLSLPLDAWLRLRRRDFADALRRSLDGIVEGGGPEASKAARAALNLDPTDERAARFLIAWEGRRDTSRALAVYGDLWRRLEDEYDAEPSAETQEMIVALKKRETIAPKTSTRPRAAERPILRVETLPTAEGAGSLTGLVRDEMISRLARFREIKVVDGALSDALGHFALRLSATGSDRRDAAATLFDQEDGSAIWASATELAENEPSSIATLTGAVAAACGISVSRARIRALAAGAPSRDAVDEWLLGQERLLNLRPRDWPEAERHFLRAAEISPGFARAWASLAQIAHGRHLAHPGRNADLAELRRSLTLSDRAVAADPHDARAHLARAWSAALLDRHAAAEASFDLALRCNPDDPWTIISAGLGAAFSGRADAAAAAVKRFEAEGWTTTPIAWAYVSNIRFLAGDLAGGAEAAESAGAVAINLPAWRAAALAGLGRTQEAAAAWDEYLTLAEDDWSGDAPFSPDAALEWFLGLFPLKKPEDRARLASFAKDAQRHWATI